MNRLIVDDYMQGLIRILNEKTNLLEKILNLTNSQSLAIDDEDTGRLESLVAEKQDKIDEINKLDEEFDAYFTRLKSFLNIKRMDELKTNEIPGTAKLKHEVEEVVAIARKISEVETRNNEKAKALLNKLGEEIKSINQMKKANQAYASGPSKPQAHFIDKKK